MDYKGWKMDELTSYSVALGESIDAEEAKIVELRIMRSEVRHEINQRWFEADLAKADPYDEAHGRDR